VDRGDVASRPRRSRARKKSGAAPPAAARFTALRGASAAAGPLRHRVDISGVFDADRPRSTLCCTSIGNCSGAYIRHARVFAGPVHSIAPFGQPGFRCPSGGAQLAGDLACRTPTAAGAPALPTHPRGPPPVRGPDASRRSNAYHATVIAPPAPPSARVTTAWFSAGGADGVAAHITSTSLSGCPRGAAIIFVAAHQLTAGRACSAEGGRSFCRAAGSYRGDIRAG